MIYYDFSKFQPMYCKRALRSTIHVSVWIVARGPWSRFGTEERTGSLIPATMLTGGEGKEGEKEEEVGANL